MINDMPLYSASQPTFNAVEPSPRPLKCSWLPVAYTRGTCRAPLGAETAVPVRRHRHPTKRPKRSRLPPRTVRTTAGSHNWSIADHLARHRRG